jgi:DNA-binding MarR family transcriptional regulator
MFASTSNTLFNAFQRLSRQIRRASHQAIREKGGLFHRQAYLLHLVAENGGANQRDLAEQMDVRPSSMTEMLMKLEQTGFIARNPDLQDQRAMRICLTDMGKREVEQLIAINDDFADSLFNTLSEEEKMQMLTIIEKLCLCLKKTNNPGSLTAETDDSSGHERIWHHEHRC